MNTRPRFARVVHLRQHLMDPKEHPTAALDLTLQAPPSLRLPCTGDRIGGKYVITNHLGEGGMGIVYEALHVRLRQPVALKFLKPAALQFPELVTRFEREARATAQLRGPHVAHVLDVDVDGQGLPYIVMERLTGRDLEAEIQLRSGPFPIGEAVDFVVQACAGMAEAHALGIVHRDLKPANLFLAEDEEGCRIVKVLDFGISKMTDLPSNVSSTCVSLGTPLYMSPEQLRASKYVDQRTDVWSLGVMLYELLAGVPPFYGTLSAVLAAVIADDAKALATFRDDVPLALENAIAKALAKDVSKRFSDVHAFAEALAPFALGPTPIFMHAVSRPSYSAVPESAPLSMARPMIPPPVITATPVMAEATPPVSTEKIAKRGTRMPNGRMVLAAGIALLCIPVLLFGTGSASTKRAVESPSLPLRESASIALQMNAPAPEAPPVAERVEPSPAPSERSNRKARPLSRAREPVAEALGKSPKPSGPAAYSEFGDRQ